MNRAQSNVIAGLLLSLAVLVGLSAASYVVIDYAYPDDPVWIASHMTESRINDVFRVDDAKKAGYSEAEIASHLARSFADKRQRYTRLLIVGAPALALTMILVAAAMLVLRRDHSQ